MDDRRCDDAHELSLVTGDSAYGPSEYIDPVGHRPSIGQWGTSDQVDTLVQAQERPTPPSQLLRRGPVFNKDGDVVHNAPQTLGDLVQSVGHQTFELLGIGLHAVSLPD